MLSEGRGPNHDLGSPSLCPVPAVRGHSCSSRGCCCFPGSLRLTPQGHPSVGEALYSLPGPSWVRKGAAVACSPTAWLYPDPRDAPQGWEATRSLLEYSKGRRRTH